MFKKNEIQIEYEYLKTSNEDSDERIYRALDMLINLNDIKTNEENNLQSVISD